MSKLSKRIAVCIFLTLFQAGPVFARSDNLIQQEIQIQIAGLESLRGMQIKVNVDERLVVLAGKVRFYNQKLISGRIAWTTLGVFEVDNAIKVVPKHPLSDSAIKRKIWEIVKANESFQAAGVLARVHEGEVILSGNFRNFRDPSQLKHKIAKIEGVVSINISAVFLARVDINIDI